jgi:exodeoxyribonuclease VII large subunit
MPVPVLTISQLTRQIKDAVEGNFPTVWVQGEVSNYTRAGSGHVYLTLKDDDSQIRAVIWKNTATRLKFELHDGLDVVAGGPVEVYEARGTYQIVVEQMIPQGIGALELAFRQLCEKLQKEGLFDPARKRPIPQFPRRIALITSPTSAAVRDILQVIGRRWRGADIVIIPVAVQGAGAGAQIAAALRMVHRLPLVDVVIAGRGGGSLEDLWAFNEEVVARAIHDCQLPVISAVGHEIDVTIADLVADRRALTPSEAAELVVPHRDELRNELSRLQQRLSHALRSQAAQARALLDHLAIRRCFTRPQEKLRDLARQLDDLDARARRAVQQHLERSRQQIAGLSGKLSALSPLQVLERGYSLTRRHPTGEVIRSAAELQPGDELETLLSQGRFVSQVMATTPVPADQNPISS